MIIYDATCSDFTALHKVCVEDKFQVYDRQTDNKAHIKSMEPRNSRHKCSSANTHGGQ